jgi:hypothetical protein
LYGGFQHLADIDAVIENDLFIIRDLVLDLGIVVKDHQLHKAAWQPTRSETRRLQRRRGKPYLQVLRANSCSASKTPSPIASYLKHLMEILRGASVVSATTSFSFRKRMLLM